LTARLAFATGRFLDLLFFAMITLLLEIVRTRCESSPEKVCEAGVSNTDCVGCLSVAD
jgi:hypothetical protein